MNSESELHKSQMTNSASPNTDFFEKKKKTKDNIILINQKPNDGGGSASKTSNFNPIGSNLRQKENINSVNQMVMGPYEKSILRDQQYGFPNNQQNTQQSTLNFLNNSSLSLTPLFTGQLGSINSLVCVISNILLIQQRKRFIVGLWLFVEITQYKILIDQTTYSINNLKTKQNIMEGIKNNMYILIILLLNFMIIIIKGKLPDYNQSTNYYQEFWKMYYTNEVIIAKLNDYKKEIQQIREKADKLEYNFLILYFIKYSIIMLRNRNIIISHKNIFQQYFSNFQLITQVQTHLLTQFLLQLKRFKGG